MMHIAKSTHRLTTLQLALFTLAATVSLVFSACGIDSSQGDKQPSESLEAPPASVEEVYSRMANAIRSSDLILHATLTAAWTTGSDSQPDHVSEYWFDGKRQRARMEFRLDPSVSDYDRASETTIVF